MLRIIGGEFRGRKLKVPAGKDVRPTSDRVREALFNLLSSMLRWEELTVIDLYAGSGALGLEALSRGAKNAIFVEASRKHMKILIQNVELMLPEQGQYKLILDHAIHWISRFSDPEKPCLVFVDPPFSGREYDYIMEKIALLPSIRTGSMIVVESPNSREIKFPDILELVKHRRYGSVTLDILRKC